MGFYRKASGGKFSTGNITLSNPIYEITIAHGLGVKPKAFFLIAKYNTHDYVNNGIACYVEDSENRYIYHTSSHTNNTVGYKNSSNELSEVTMDAENITIPTAIIFSNRPLADGIIWKGTYRWFAIV